MKNGMVFLAVDHPRSVNTFREHLLVGDCEEYNTNNHPILPHTTPHPSLESSTYLRAPTTSTNSAIDTVDVWFMFWRSKVGINVGLM